MLALYFSTVVTLVGFAPASDHQTVGYVSGCGHRGTFDLLWSCLVTLFVCVWSVLHLNVPGPDDTAWTKFGRRIKYMISLVLAPEAVCGWACAEWTAARLSIQPMREAGYTNWSMVHGFFAGQGGFVLESGAGTKRRRLPLVWRQLLVVMDPAYGITVPVVTKQEINDKSKADKFVKGLACVQSLWLFIDVIARGVQGLAVSQLEIMTISYVFCAIVTYAFCWYKPYGVEVPFLMHYPDDIPDELLNKLKSASADIDDEWKHQFQKQRVMNWDLSDKSVSKHELIILLIAGFCFSSLHLLAWDFYFPSTHEALLWKHCSIAALVSWEVLIIALQLLKDEIKRVNDDDIQLALLVMGLILCAYLFSRIFLVFESFWALRAEPMSAYETVSWLNIIPHV